MSWHCHQAFIVLAARDWLTLVDFYTQLLQKSPESSISGVYAEYQLGGLHLGIFNPKADERPIFEGTTSGGMSLCFEVENLEEAIAHLTDLGYPPFGKIIKASHGCEIYASDPEGNRLILHQSAI